MGLVNLMWAVFKNGQGRRELGDIFLQGGIVVLFGVGVLVFRFFFSFLSLCFTSICNLLGNDRL